MKITIPREHQARQLGFHFGHFKLRKLKVNYPEPICDIGLGMNVCTRYYETVYNKLYYILSYSVYVIIYHGFELVQF